jgi:hypothetical protein
LILSLKPREASSGEVSINLWSLGSELRLFSSMKVPPI